MFAPLFGLFTCFRLKKTQKGMMGMVKAPARRMRVNTRHGAAASMCLYTHVSATAWRRPCPRRGAVPRRDSCVPRFPLFVRLSFLPSPPTLRCLRCVVEALKAFGSRPLAISRCQFTFVLAFAFLLHFRTCLGCVRGGKARCVVSFVDGCSFWLCPS